MKYYVIEEAGKAYSLYEFDPPYSVPDDDFDWQEDARAAANDYHFHHNGLDMNWPLTFVLIGFSGNEIGRFKVERREVPDFRATVIKEKVAP